MSSYLIDFSKIDPDFCEPKPVTVTINPYEPGTCGKIICQSPAVVTLADNSRAMRYCDAHAEHVRRTMEWFPIYSTPLAV